MKISLVIILLLTGCPIIAAWEATEIITEEVSVVPDMSNQSKEPHKCACDNHGEERKQYETCDIQGRYREDGDYLCCGFCWKVCAQRPRRW